MSPLCDLVMNSGLFNGLNTNHFKPYCLTRILTFILMRENYTQMKFTAAKFDGFLTQSILIEFYLFL